jgi:hypothetical protein
LSISDVVPQPEAHEWPTAQVVPAGPELTPFSPAACPGLGLDVRDQELPSHRKISVRNRCDAVPQADSQDSPTAHAVPPGAPVTACSTVIRRRLGPGIRDHLLPFQRRISALPTSEAVPQPDVHE